MPWSRRDLGRRLDHRPGPPDGRAAPRARRLPDGFGLRRTAMSDHIPLSPLAFARADEYVFTNILSSAEPFVRSLGGPGHGDRFPGGLSVSDGDRGPSGRCGTRHRL
ncbi:protein of unknown function [Magnetospirillum gryphiswaldense MSR-1 v2]|uniref:Uncharacterized protein n=1 Tax=Magnetospirillum gryphiswaldense (strain DSM 6361 / JCM 21280 / NBRC 15271 / MSR-1) TaxID=431944 RepID=V6EXF4_MAGGM|nr:protein of unknown function [Magnetospirillum gryphiswaldense MSR-1 v2]